MAGWGAVDFSSDLLDRVLGTQPDPPATLVAVTAALALLVVAVRPSWRLARNGITIAHEGGHALAAVLVGRRLSGIRLHSDTSGLTLSRGRPSGLGMALTLLAGYLTPSLLGLGGAWLLAEGRITLLLWVSLALLFAVLLMIRNLYGLLSVLVAGAAIFGVTSYTEPEVQAAFAYAFVWFLLVGGVRPVGELQSLRWRGRAPDSDADQLAGITWLPGLLWVGFFGLVNLAALALAVSLLLAPALTDLTG
ncbi:MAG: M50 family peptidase [Micromonosporaceae bacterium]|nr:M50 family peptidase [Micromonosporaceae bacterium]